MLAQTAEPIETLVSHPVGILAVLLTVLAAIFWFGEQTMGQRLFKIVPALLFCYFIPTALTTAEVIPDKSELYEWVKSYLLPCSLVLLILSLDVPAILRLGPKAVIMLMAGTVGVVVGGPLALFVCSYILPDSMALPGDIWRGMAALCGSWIGGGANMVALGEVAEVSKDMFSNMVIVDVFIASLWMAVLLYLSGHQERIDKWTGANTDAIEDLKRRTSDFQARVTRVPTLTDLLLILAIGFVAMWLSYKAGLWLAEHIVVHPPAEATNVSEGAADAVTVADAAESGGAEGDDPKPKPFLSATTWKFILVTTIGVLLSYTPARKLEGAGASKIGSAMIFLLVACIGASANFDILDLKTLGLIIMGLIWMLTHVTFMLVIGKLIRAPIFFVAVGSQSNIGGAASAPVVAAAYHPALAPVGALLAVAGYVLGTYAGLLCMWMLKGVAGAE